MTIDQRLAEVRGFGPGFDALRVALAICVVWIHVPPITGSPAFTEPLWMFPFSLLPMFFALSGFLVAGSAGRLTLRAFVANRAFRILPALAVEICLSALVLGPIVTQDSLQAYFSDIKFYRYFCNIFGFIQYQLPGVFLNSRYTGVVNGSLWTVPHEIFCYILMSVIILFGLLKRPFVVLALTLLVLVIAIVLQSTEPHESSLFLRLDYAFVYRGAARLVPAFLIGGLIYQYRASVPFDWRIALACAVGCIGFQVLGNSQWQGLVWVQALSTPLLAYITVFVGLSGIPKLPILKGGDYSYGIYLYSCPIQQTLIWALPALTNNAFNFFISLLLSTAFAAFSWHIIEEPALRFRKSFSLHRADGDIPDPGAQRLSDRRDTREPKTSNPGGIVLSSAQQRSAQ